MIRTFKVGKYERAFLYEAGELVGVLGTGRHWFFDPLLRLRVERHDITDPRVASKKLDVIVKAGVLGDEARVLDLADGQRALVWVDGRLEYVLAPGLHAFWTVMKEVRVEVLDATKVRIETEALSKLLSLPGTAAMIELVDVEASTAGLYHLNGVYQETLGAGRYAFWKGEGRVAVRMVDLREQAVDVNGQEIMTKDKVTLRLNTVVTYSVADAETCLVATSDLVQLIYREVQLALRAMIGKRTLDGLLEEKDGVAAELEASVAPRLAKVGVTLQTFGIKDIILPGEMKELLNRVTEAKKAAEANLVTRREEVAAVCSQLNVVLGDRGLADKVVKLL